MAARELSNYFAKLLFKQYDINPKSLQPGGLGMSNYSAYRNYINGYPNDILQLYLEYDDMDRNSEDIQDFLNSVSEESTLKNKEINATVWVESKHSDIAAHANKLIRRLNMDSNATPICRNIAKYGRWVVRPVFSEETEKQRRIVSIIDRDYEDSMWQYQYDDFYFRKVLSIYDKGRFKGFSHEGEEYNPWDFVEFKLGSSLFGESFLFQWYTHYRSLNLLERSLELFRISKSPQLIVYGVPVGQADPIETVNILKMYESFVESQTRSSNQQTGIDKQASPPSPLLNMYVPVHEKGRADVQVFSNTADVNAIADIDYKRGKFLDMIGKPRPENYDPSKYLSQVNIKVLGKIERLQTAFMEGMDRLIQINFALINVAIDEDSYIIKMSKPSDLDEITRLEKLQLAADVTAQLFELGANIQVDEVLWKRFIIEIILGNYYGEILDKYQKYKTDQEKKEKENYTESEKVDNRFVEFRPVKKYRLPE